MVNYDYIITKPKLENVLEHFGVKGMRWGHRKSIKKAYQNVKKKQQFVDERSKKYKAEYKAKSKNPLIDQSKRARRQADIDYYKEVKGYSDKKAKAVHNTKALIGWAAAMTVSQIITHKIIVPYYNGEKILNKNKSKSVNDLIKEELSGPDMVYNKKLKKYVPNPF